jgi:succinate-acetate transporter protein
MLMCTLKSTVAFFFLFFTLDLAFLMLSLAYYFPTAAGGANVALNTAGAAWYNALAGLLEPTNSFFLVGSVSLCAVIPFD